jgi:hypothetical protein
MAGRFPPGRWWHTLDSQETLLVVKDVHCQQPRGSLLAVGSVHPQRPGENLSAIEGVQSQRPRENLLVIESAHPETPRENLLVIESAYPQTPRGNLLAAESVHSQWPREILLAFEGIHSQRLGGTLLAVELRVFSTAKRSSRPTRVYTLGGQEVSSQLLRVYTFNNQEKHSWPLRVYTLDNQEGLSAVKGAPSAAGRNPTRRWGLFWVRHSQPLWGLVFFLIKFYGDPTPKPTDGFGGLTPIFWGILGVLGFGSWLSSFWELISQDTKVKYHTPYFSILEFMGRAWLLFFSSTNEDMTPLSYDSWNLKP